MEPKCEGTSQTQSLEPNNVTREGTTTVRGDRADTVTGDRTNTLTRDRTEHSVKRQNQTQVRLQEVASRSRGRDTAQLVEH